MQLVLIQSLWHIALMLKMIPTPTSERLFGTKLGKRIRFVQRNVMDVTCGTSEQKA